MNNGSPVNVVLSENAYSDVELAHSGRVSHKESPGDTRLDQLAVSRDVEEMDHPARVPSLTPVIK